MDGDKPVVVIEHLEPEFRLWIFLEYRHVSTIYGRDYVWFTNIPVRYSKVLERYGRVFQDSIVDLVKRRVIDIGKAIVLDPQASKPLSYDDLLVYKYVIIGGILGDHPPRGRTKEYLTNRLRGIESRNIGDGQYSIDGSVYYIYYLWKNKGLHGFKYVDGVTIETKQGNVYLPFRYPIVGDKPLLAPGLMEYLRGEPLPREIIEELGLSK